MCVLLLLKLLIAVKKSVKRSIEIKLNGKPFSLHLEHAGFEIKPTRITTLEEKIQDTLPSDYKEFMLAYNGGTLLTSVEEPTPKPVLQYFSNIKEMDDLELPQAMLEGVTIEKNSLALIGGNYDGSIKTFIQLKGKKKGEIYHYDFHQEKASEVFQKPSFKSFTDCLNSLAKSEYGTQVAKAVSKPSSPREEIDFEKNLNKLPLNSTKFPSLPAVIRNLFDTIETTENEHGRILIKNKQDKQNLIVTLVYIRDIMHEKSDIDIQHYFNYYTPFRHFTVSETDLEDLLKDFLIDENDEITKKGVEFAEKFISEESSKVTPRTSIRPESYKRYVDVVLGGRSTNLQLTQIGANINEARVKKFEKELGNTLPKDYREFLLGYNGGYSKQSNLIIDGGVETTAIKIYRDIQTLEERLTGGPASIEWMAIGTDRNEHLVYINLKGDKRGCIYRYKYDDDSDGEDLTRKRSGTFSDAPKQLLANSFLEYVLNVITARDDPKDDYIDEEYLDLILSDEIKTKFPQLTGVMYTLYDSAEKEVEQTGRATVENKQDIQNIILLVKFLTTSNSEAFSTVLNHTPFKFINITDAHMEELKKNKLLDKNSKLTRKGKDEVEKLLAETKVKEFPIDTGIKKGKDRKKPKPVLPKVVAEKKDTLKRKLEDTDIRHTTRSATKEKEGFSASKKR